MFITGLLIIAKKSGDHRKVQWGNISVNHEDKADRRLQPNPVPRFLCSHRVCRRSPKSQGYTVSPSMWLGFEACLLGESKETGGLQQR